MEVIKLWSRAIIKNKAKGTLKGNYWQSFLISLILLITGGSHNQGQEEVGIPRVI